MSIRNLLLAAIAATLMLSGSALAQKQPSTAAASVSSEILRGEGPDGTPTATFPVDISGQESPGLSCAAGNIPSRPTRTVNLGAGATITGIGWNTILETIGESWASEAQISFGTQSQRVLINLRVGAGTDASTPAGGTAFVGGPIDLSENALPNIVLDADGLLYLTFCETFVDNAGAADARFLSPSSLSILCFNCSQGAPDIGVAPTTLDFGGVAVGSTSSTQSFTITNNGNASGNVTALNVTGPFAVATGGTCPTTFPFPLAAEASCTVNLSFSPVAAGAASGSASITLNPAVGAGPTSVALSGTGTVASFSLSAGALSFGNVPTGSSSAVSFITITNTGGAAGSVDSLVFSGPFTRSGGTCGTPPFQLAAGASCTVGVVFNAGGIGSFTGSLTVNGAGQSAVVTLTGSSVLPTPAFIPVSNAWSLGLLIALMGLIAGVFVVRRQG